MNTHKCSNLELKTLVYLMLRGETDFVSGTVE